MNPPVSVINCIKSLLSFSGQILLEPRISMGYLGKTYAIQGMKEVLDLYPYVQLPKLL